MRSLSLRPLAVATLLVSSIAAGASADAPVELAPVAWTAADTGGPPIPVSSPQWAVSIWVEEWCVGGRCFDGQNEVFLDPGTTTFDQTIGRLRVRGTLVSSVSGNVWSFGMRNVRVTHPPLPPKGMLLTAGSDTLTSWTVNVASREYAAFTVPFDGKSPTTPIAWRQTGSANNPGAQLWSGKLQQAGVAAGTSSMVVGDLIAGDHVTIYGFGAGFSLRQYVEVIAVGSNQARVGEVLTDAYPDCVSGAQPPAGYDCSGDVHLFTPRIIPAAAAACAADLTGDRVVNFADLARMKSAFFQSCQLQPSP